LSILVAIEELFMDLIASRFIDFDAPSTKRL